MIHGTVDKSEKISIDKEALLNRLSFYHRGKGKAITSYELAKELDVKITNTNQALRKACKELLEAGHPIISCTKGFYCATNRTELTEFRENLQSRINGLARDIHYVDELINQQERLF